MNTKDKVGTAIIGCGAISEIYFENLTKEFAITHVIGCCDLNKELAQRCAAKYGIKAMEPEEIIGDDSIEIVVNLTNPGAHYGVIKQLLENGKHVYTEKVITPEFEKAKELVRLAGEKNRFLCSAPDTFLGAAVQTAKWVVDSGMIGTVTSCISVLQRDAGLLAEKFPFTIQPGGGIGIDVGIYYTTAMINILGPVRKVCGMSGVLFPEQTHYFVKNDNFGKLYTQKPETYLTGSLEFSCGCIGTLHFNSRSIRTEKPYVAFYGTEGILFLEDPNSFGGDVKVILKGRTEATIVPYTHAYYGNNRGLGVAEMAWSLRKGRIPRTHAAMALHALEILTGITESQNTQAFYEMETTFSLPDILPRGFLGNEYAASDPEAGLSI